MPNPNKKVLSYFPGCSMATTARESNDSLMLLFEHLGYELLELEDWNCCGSSSAHSIDQSLAFDLATRNLSLADPARPLLVACPSCTLRLRHAQITLEKETAARKRFESRWGKSFSPDLKIVNIFDTLNSVDVMSFSRGRMPRLSGLRFVTYYGCMLARPPAMRHQKNYYGFMENVLRQLGAGPIDWPFSSRCCGTFLTAARPDIIAPMVDQIVRGAVEAGADAVVTACAMCHLNLEVRCSLKNKVPILHFSELLSLAFGLGRKRKTYKKWFSRHLINPKPFLKSMNLY